MNIKRLLPPNMAGRRAAANAEQNIRVNGLAYPSIMGKFQAEMMNLPPRLWLRLVELCVMNVLDDAKAAELDRLIESARCGECGQIGRACTCTCKGER